MRPTRTSCVIALASSLVACADAARGVATAKLGVGGTRSVDSSSLSRPDAPVALLRDGRVAVADDDHIVIIGTEGQSPQRVGRRGDGPGEYRKLAQVVALSGDTLLVFDIVTHRVTVLAPPNWTVARTLRVQSSSRASPVAVFPQRPGQGYFVWYRAAYVAGGRRAPQPRDLLRMIREDGSLERDSLFLAQAREDAVIRTSNGGIVVAANPLGAESFFASDGPEAVYLVESSSLTVRRVDRSGAVRILTQPTVAALPVETSELDTLFKEAPPAWRQLLLDKVKSTGVRTWPIATAVFADDEDRLWVRARHREQPKSEWLVFSPSGALLFVASDERLRNLRAVRRNQGVLVGRDSLDTPIVSIVSLVRGITK